MPSTQLSHTARAPANLEKAWDRLQQAETWEAIPGVDRVFDARHAADGSLLSYGFEATAGGTRYRGMAIVIEARAPTYMHLDIEASEVVGWIQTELSGPNDDQISITVTVRLEAKGLLSTVFFPVLKSTVSKGLPASTEDFAARLSES